MSGVLLHTFATAAYLPWLELLLESVWLHSGDNLHVWVDTINVADVDLARMRERYSNVALRNRSVSEVEMATELRISPKQLYSWKLEVANTHVNHRNFLYKVFISVNQRYRRLDQVIAEATKAGYDTLIHADADLYVRTDLSKSVLVEEVSHHDVSAYINDSAAALQHHRKVFGAFLCFNLKSHIHLFVETWMSEIDRVPLSVRWKGYGQSVLFYAMNERRETDVFDLNKIEGRFRASRSFAKDAHIWFGSNARVFSGLVKKTLRLRGRLSRGSESRRRCWKDLNGIAARAGKDSA